MSDAATREQLWKDPNWTCSRCQYSNLAIRHACRECGYIGGEMQILDFAFIEVTPRAGGEG